MTSSDNSVLRTVREMFSAVRRPPGLSRYDVVLAVIPLAFLSALFATTVLSMPFQQTAVVASLVGGATVIDALFLNPPAHSSSQSSA